MHVSETKSSWLANYTNRLTNEIDITGSHVTSVNDCLMDTIPIGATDNWIQNYQVQKLAVSSRNFNRLLREIMLN